MATSGSSENSACNLCYVQSAQGGTYHPVMVQVNTNGHCMPVTIYTQHMQSSRTQVCMYMYISMSVKRNHNILSGMVCKLCEKKLNIKRVCIYTPLPTM